MSSTANLQRESDSEEDHDYVPPAGDVDSSDSEQPRLKRARTSSPKLEDPDISPQARQQLWKDFQTSVESDAKRPVQPVEVKRLVKIEKTFLFAGERVVQVVEVPEDSTDAKKWPRWQPKDPSPEAGPSSPALASASATNAQPPHKSRPGPRKPKTTLAAIPTQKARKLSTLDKSAMDWKAHISAESPSVRDDLNANRRGGGYLEKVEFLERVDARKEDLYEANKSSKRRR